MRHPVRAGLPDLPPAVKRLPVDARGYPVPFFVAWVDGEPDHRIVEPIKLLRCVREGRCWICGETLMLPVVCVIGPMCGVNHVSSEPPSHEACARFAVRGCPFLSKPHMRRREAGMPEDSLQAPGAMLAHNPGVSLLWWTTQVSAFKVKGPSRSTNLLFDIGDPQRVEWWTEGRLATRAEAERAIVEGLPKLMTLAGGGADEIADLSRSAERLLQWLPA